MKKYKTSTTGATGSRKILVSILLLMFLCSGTKIISQERWRATIKTGANFLTKKMENADLNTGIGFNAAIAYRIMPHVFVNAGWGWNHFSTKKNPVDLNTDYEETGYKLGVQFNHPINSSKLGYALSGNAIYNHIEVENSKGELVSDSGHGWGWSTEAALVVPLGKRTHLLPGISYHSLSRDIKSGNMVIPADLNYLSAGIGISWSF